MIKSSDHNNKWNKWNWKCIWNKLKNNRKWTGKIKNYYVGESWLLTETVRGFSTGDAGRTNPAAMVGRGAGGTIGTAAPINKEQYNKWVNLRDTEEFSKPQFA